MEVEENVEPLQCLYLQLYLYLVLPSQNDIPNPETTNKEHFASDHHGHYGDKGHSDRPDPQNRNPAKTKWDITPGPAAT